MLRFGIVLATVLIMLSPKRAAATVFTFQSMETSALSPSPVMFSFSLDTAAAQLGGGGTTFSNVTINENGQSTTGNAVAALFNTNLSSPLFFLVDTSSTPFYSGSGTGIHFNLGSFVIADGLTDGTGTLSITSNAVPPVPEPATWTLLFAGVAALIVVRGFSGARSRAA